MRFILGLSIVLSIQACAQPKQDWQWFVNQTTCAGHQITVRMKCDALDHNNGWHRFCGEQQIIFTDSKHQVIKKDLGEKDDLIPDGPRHLGVIRCVDQTNQSNPIDEPGYLLMLFDNGGNCDTCEIDGVMDLEGNWKRYGNTWFTKSKLERQKIKALDWDKYQEFYISNKTLESKKKK